MSGTCTLIDSAFYDDYRYGNKAILYGISTSPGERFVINKVAVRADVGTNREVYDMDLGAACVRMPPP